MKKPKTDARQRLIAALNEDLSREYQAIIAYVVYSQVLKGAAYMSIANELETHATEELGHALIVSKLVETLTCACEPMAWTGTFCAWSDLMSVISFFRLAGFSKP